MEPGGRRIALDVLLRVLRGGAWSGITLDAAFKERPGLERRERALATELVYGTLRRAPGLDAALASQSRRALGGLDDRVLVLLRLGAYQLLHMRVPDHAAVGETVALAKEVGAGGATGFVNGVLRSLSRAGPPSPPPIEEDPEQNLLITEALPPWLFREWRKQLPLEEVARLAHASNEPAPLHLRAASSSHRDEALERLSEAGVAAKRAPLSPVGLILEQGAHPERIPGWDELGLQPQDEGAQLVSYFALLPGAAGAKPPRRLLDACAAPGGKTCHLAQALPGAHVVATDLHRRRAARVGTEAKRLGLGDRVEVHAADALKALPFAGGEGFDLILVDAPCSGLGTLRRHPEIKLTRSEADVARLSELQLELLFSLAENVTPGGRLVYAVCTTTRSEGVEVAERFLEADPRFEPDPPVSPERASVDLGSIPWDRLLAPDGSMALWTHRHGTDCFFAARFRRKAG